jgi:hypothetical protein
VNDLEGLLDIRVSPLASAPSGQDKCLAVHFAFAVPPALMPRWTRVQGEPTSLPRSPSAKFGRPTYRPASASPAIGTPWSNPTPTACSPGSAATVQPANQPCVQSRCPASMVEPVAKAMTISSATPVLTSGIASQRCGLPFRGRKNHNSATDKIKSNVPVTNASPKQRRSSPAVASCNRRVGRCDDP